MGKAGRKIVLRGYCDITAISFFLKEKGLCIQEMNHIGSWNLNYSTYLAQAAAGKRSCYVKPLCYPDDSFFNGELDLLVFSVLSEPMCGLYRGKEGFPDLRLGLSNEDYCTNWMDFDGDNCISKEDWFAIHDHYEYVGLIDIDEAVANVVSFVNAIPKNTNICILLGPTMPNAFKENSPPHLKFNTLEFYKSFNKKIKEIFVGEPRVSFIEPCDFYKTPKKQKDIFFSGYTSVAHYPRRTYYLMAKELRRRYGHRFKINYTAVILRRIRKLFSFAKRTALELLHKARRKLK